MTALPFLAGAGVLPKKWSEPESKAYVRDVATNAHPFCFVSPKNFGDETLSTAARTCVKKRVGEGQQNALPAKRASGVAAQPAAGPETQKQHGSGAAHVV